MFLSLYGLTEQPFGVTPNPKFLYHSANHREVLASLVYAIESDLGFSAVVAQPGMGKTTLLMYLLEKYQDTARTAVVFHTQCNSIDLLRYVLQEFDEPVDQLTDQVVLHDRLQRILLLEARAKRRVLVVIDEAQNLGRPQLEAIRLLSDFETRERKLLHIVLAGQEQLYKKLTSPDVRQLLQRLPMLSRLRPLNSKETQVYVGHRLSLAGRRDPLFTPSALEAIFRYSGGVPRDINRICFNALSIGYVLKTPVIDEPVVMEVVRDLQLTTAASEAEVETLVSPGEQAESTPVPSADAARTMDRWFGAANTAPAYVPTVTATPKMPASAASAPADDSIPAIAAADPREFPKKSGEGAADIHSTVRHLQSMFAPPVSTVADRDVVTQAEPSFSNLTKTAHKSGVLQARVRQAPEPDGPAFDRPTKRTTASGARRRNRRMALLRIAVTLASIAIASIAIYASFSDVRSNEHKGAPVSHNQLEEPADQPATPTNAGGTQKKQTPRPAGNARRRSPVAEAPAPVRAIRSIDLPPTTANRPANTLEHPPQLLASSLMSPIAKDAILSVPTAAIPVKAGTHIQEAKLLSMVKPSYPRVAAGQNMQGPVVINATVLKTGNVGDVDVVSGNALLANAAVNAVRQWRYRPAYVDGRPVDVNIRIKVDFRMDSAPK